MATNMIQDGVVLEVTAPYAVTAGAGVQVGTKLHGIALAAAANGAAVRIATRGVWSVAKVSAQAWAVGDLIYWDNTAKLFTTTSTSNLLVGVAVAAAANPSSTGTLRLNGSFA